ncbi:DnaB-like helicase N terminal domain-containing protein [Kaistia soli DSM 19436]|uniref:DNA 5'-3' helicase n=1 Tax=Kaistia soli DSM 19436 TaxID=1122133 RepID=A0A1M5MQ54_9HYPH|nr:DnaB-like helicase C-terminal domain-containing protein [Kaistia soli]SHG79202.1 DnaB-like helicase N terminal domain-containing protein [Kaistia soli DSM 19436]
MSNVHPFQPYDEPLPLPQNLELEIGLIGCLMRDQAIFDRVAGFVDADDFFLQIHKDIWRASAALIAQGRPANPVTLKGAFDPSIRVEHWTLIEYLIHLMSEAGLPMNAVDYAQGIRALAIRRAMIRAAEDIREMAMAASPIAKIEAILKDCEEAFSEAAGRHKPVEDIDPAQQAINEISHAYQRQASDAVPWFLSEIGAVLGDDLEYGWLVGLLADSGGGKTSFALQQAEHALRKGVPVLFLSGDQKPAEVYRQIASQRASVQSSDLRKGRASEQEVAASIAVINDLSKRPLQVRKMGRPTTAEISMWVRAFNRQFGKGLVIIDHAKRVGFTDRRAMLAEGVNQVYGDLKALMQETENAGLLLMQRNSDGGGRDNPRPVRSDCYGGAGALENLDGLIALYVEEQWTSHLLAMARTDKRKDEIRARAALAKDLAEIVGLKARFGPGGNSQEIKREARYTRFASLVDDWRGGQQGLEL